MNKCLYNDLAYLNNQFTLADDINNIHVLLDEYKITKDQKILAKIDKYLEIEEKDYYIIYPFKIGYDTIIKRMNNYHLLIPEVLKLPITTITDMFMLLKILLVINQEMYDEYRMVAKCLARSIDNYKDDDALFNLLIKIAVANGFISNRYLKLLTSAKSDEQLINQLLDKYEQILIEKGIKDVYVY